MSRMDISVVILSWNDKPYLEKCLQSLADAPPRRSLEIIVVDNASTDGSPEMVAARFPGVKVIRNPVNLGFPGGNNAGFLASRGRCVCLLNSDIHVFPGCLDGLADYLDRNPRVGMVGPKILNRDLTHQSSCRQFPSLWTNFCAATGLTSVFSGGRFFSGEHMFYFRGDRVREVDVLVGCFWAVRREAVREVGLLDEGFFMFAEDLDWCRRFWEAGWRVAFDPEAQAIHYRGGSSAKKDEVWLALTQQRSVLHYWKKHHGLAANLAIRCLITLHRIIRWAAAGPLSLLAATARGDRRGRGRVARACLRDLFASGPENSVGLRNRTQAVPPL